jgi:hypothetical protein
MSWRHFIMLAVGISIVPACSRGDGNAGGDSSNQPGPTLSTPSLFSYQAPSGWGSKVAGAGVLGGFPQAVGPASNNFTPDITFVTDGYQTINQFAKTYKPHLVDMEDPFPAKPSDQPFPMKLVDQEPFVTAAGVKGIRLHAIDPANPPLAEQFSYIFPNPDGMVFEFACACAPADAARYAPIFDASMKTVVILQPGGG